MTNSSTNVGVRTRSVRGLLVAALVLALFSSLPTSASAQSELRDPADAAAPTEPWGIEGAASDANSIVDEVSTHIIKGTVVDTTSIDTGSEVYTVAEVSVTEQIRGELADTIQVAVSGGIADDGLQLIVSHQPFISAGERLRFSLVETPPEIQSQLGAETYSIVGGIDGVKALEAPGLVISQADAAGDFALTGEKIPPSGFPMGYRILNSTPAWANTEIQESFGSWSGTTACIDIQFNYQGTTGVSPLGSIDGINVVGYAPTPNPAETYLAEARWYFNPATRETVQFDIRINLDDHPFTDVGAGGSGGFDLRTVIEHEIGHVLGLDHSFDPGDLMFPVIPPNIWLAIGPGAASGAIDLYYECSFPTPPSNPLGFVPITPCTMLDTRFGTNFTDPFTGVNRPLPGQTSIAAQITGSVGASLTNQPCAAAAPVPTNAVAAMVNVVAVAPSQQGNLRVSTAGLPANGGVVNFGPGTNGPATNSNAIPVALSNNGAIAVRVNSNAINPATFRYLPATHVRVVVLGYYVSAANPAALGFVPVTPCAVFDTRYGSAYGAHATGGTTLTAQITGSVPTSNTNESCAQSGVVPSNATGVMVNAVAVDPRASGNLRVSASGASAGGGVVNFGRGTNGPGTNSNAIPVGLSSGKIDVVVNAPNGVSASHVRLVVLGYYINPALSAVEKQFVPVTACAVFDTRFGSAYGAPANGNSTLTAQITGPIPASNTNESCAQGGVVPANATGVMVNLIAVQPTRGGNMRISASGTTANGGVVNFGPGNSGPGTNSNAVPVELSNGKVDVFVKSAGGVPSTHVRLVVLGYYL